MKHFFLIALAFVAALTLGSCDKTENGDGDKNEFDKKLFAQKYTIDADGFCVLEGQKPLTAAEIASSVTGYGWKTVGTYEVEDNGHLSKTDYWQDRVGGSPTDYWFESSSNLTSYFSVDAVPASCYRNLTWSYDAQKGFIMYDTSNSTASDLTSQYMQVLKIGESHGKTLMYTMQKLGYLSDGTNRFGMIVYQRMTDKELDDMKRNYTYDIDKDRTVPDNCKFRIQAYYNADGNDNENHTVFQTFRLVTFQLTDEYGLSSSSAPYYEYFDSITWASDCRDMPDSFGIMQRKTNSLHTAYWWSTYFFTPHNNTTVYANGYKDGRIVYKAHKQLYLVNDGFFGYDWDEIRLNAKNPELTEYCLLDKSREFVLTPPTAFNNDMKTPYAELRITPKNISGKSGTEEYTKAKLAKERDGLIKIMNQYYDEHCAINNEDNRKYILGKLKTLPEDADIKIHWETEHSNMVLVLKEDKEEPTNSEYYIKAEPK